MPDDDRPAARAAYKAAPGPARATETAAPSRNFTLTVEDRIRALAGGVPACIRRKRRIEDLEARIVAMIAELEEDIWATTTDAGQVEEQLRARAPAELIEQLNDLVNRHNRWYPYEANLALHPRTGEILEGGAPWKALPRPSFDTLRAKAAARVFD
jgi:hypothetical protein